MTVEFMSSISETVCLSIILSSQLLSSGSKPYRDQKFVDRESNTRRLLDRMTVVQQTTTRAFSKDVV